MSHDVLFVHFLLLESHVILSSSSVTNSASWRSVCLWAINYVLTYLLAY